MPLPRSIPFRPSQKDRAHFWAITFHSSGLLALICYPLVRIFERFHWFEGPVHLTALIACVTCVLGATMYLASTSQRGDTNVRPTPEMHTQRVSKSAITDLKVLGLPARPMAYLALILAGGFLVLLLIGLLLLAASPGF
jgi:hypothetical protein